MVLRLFTQIGDGPIYGNSILDSLPISAAQAGKNVHANAFNRSGMSHCSHRRFSVSRERPTLAGRCPADAIGRDLGQLEAGLPIITRQKRKPPLTLRT